MWDGFQNPNASSSIYSAPVLLRLRLRLQSVIKDVQT